MVGDFLIIVIIITFIVQFTIYKSQVIVCDTMYIVASTNVKL